MDSIAEVVSVTPQGSILRIAFSGVHKDGLGTEAVRYVCKAIEQHRPAAIVLDFAKFKYRFGNDIGGIVQAFVIKGPDGEVALRPAAVVATGPTAKALTGLLRPARVLDTFHVEFFDDVPSAVSHLRTKLGLPTA